MKKRKIIILFVSILFLVAFLLIFLFFSGSHKEKPVNHRVPSTEIEEENPITDSVEEEEIISTEEVVETEIKKEESTSSPSKEEKTKHNTNNNSNNNHSDHSNTPSKPEAKPEPTITYTCPDGYELNGTECINYVNKESVCPENTTSYSNDDIPRDTYCINLSDHIDSTDGTCPSGYGIVRVLGWGGPDTYHCHPLYERILICPDGYHDNGNVCSKVIAATEHTTEYRIKM